jgi:hypothetical protein
MADEQRGVGVAVTIAVKLPNQELPSDPTTFAKPIIEIFNKAVAEAFPGIESIGVSMRLANGVTKEAMKIAVAYSAFGSLETLARAEAGDSAITVMDPPECREPSPTQAGGLRLRFEARRFGRGEGTRNVDT